MIFRAMNTTKALRPSPHRLERVIAALGALAFGLGVVLVIETALLYQQDVLDLSLARLQLANLALIGGQAAVAAVIVHHLISRRLTSA